MKAVDKAIYYKAVNDKEYNGRGVDPRNQVECMTDFLPGNIDQ